MNHIDRRRVTEEKLGLMARVDAKLGVTDVRGYALLDDRYHTGFANDRFTKLRAFYMDIGFGGPEPMSPRYVFDVMTRPDCEHFIWISRREAEASLPRFVWIYAHEVQHLVQRLHDRLCARANSLIRASYGMTDHTPKLPLEFPAELDAELTARNVVRDLLGRAVLDRYVEDQSIDPVGRAYYERFRELERSWRGLRRETAAVVRARKDELRALQQELPDREFQFDLDLLCGSPANARLPRSRLPAGPPPASASMDRRRP
jgi:hypothetical protein